LNASQPIGIFDSGIGGLTVARSVSAVLPGEQIIYFGDTAHLPYGDKSAESIQHYAIRISDFLLSRNCKLILIACHTASAHAFAAVEKHVEGRVPVINVIDPIVHSVAGNQNLKKVGIIGTKGTIKSGVYEQKLKTLNPAIETVSLATALLASMIEAGFYNNSVSQAVINSYLAYPDFSDIDGMVLGCTHYPLIKKEVAQFFNNRIQIFDSGELAAWQVNKILTEKNLLNQQTHPVHEFYVSDFTESFEQTSRIFFGNQIHLEKLNLWE
jgi:glutamate racemase